jgi:alpha-beta hydrolase superfamily lysophospholipase
MSELPGPIEPTTKTTIETSDGALYAEAFMPAGTPKGSVVVTHGFFEHSGRYREVAHVLVNAGWAALVWDVRGHGKSAGERGYIARFDQYLDDLRLVLAAAKALAPGKPSVLLGHSHGSLITLRALCGDNPPDVTCAVVSSPWLGAKMRIPAAKIWLSKVFTHVMPKFAEKNPLTVDQLTNDKAKQKERLADTGCHDRATVRWFTEATAAQQYVLAHADRIRVPVTWFVGAEDSIADPAASRRVADRMTRSTYHDLKGFKHEVFNEVDRGKVFAQLTSVLDACSAASAA